MKKKFTLLAFVLATVLATTTRTYAADLIVEENGVAPNYATIQAAVTAATSGDRIFVKNKAGNVPYNENVTITAKSLSLLAYDPDGVFYVFGTYTINVTSGQEINIIGMNNASGNIAAFAASTLANPTRVNIMNCTLTSGNVALDFLGYVAHLAGNTINGNVTVRTSTVTGNLIDGTLTINSPTGNVTGYGDDTLYVVGNRLTAIGGGLSAGGIVWNNNQDYYFIANNHVRTNTHQITISSTKAGSGTNNIENNSLERTTQGTIYGIFVSGALAAGTNLMIRNNSIYESGGSNSYTEYAVNFGTITGPSFVNLDYNVWRGFLNGLTNASTVTVSQTGNATSTTQDNNDVTGVCTAAECVNLGSPSTDYTDLDLSRNDVGVAGGSYNYNNFWPNTGGARVYLVRTPRTVVQSSTINAKADSFDK